MPLNPLTKNFWLITITVVVRSNCVRPIAIWFSAIKEGNGHPHIICPIDTYINGIRNTSEAISLLFIFGVSVSFSISSAAAADAVPPFPFSAFFSDAPYPDASTAAMISDADAVPSTPMELVSRLTEHEVTPGTLDTAFSTRLLHAAQLIPVTRYCSIFSPSCSIF